MKDMAADGLRGIAAMNVFLAHFFLAFYPMGFAHLFPWVASPGAQVGLAEKVLAIPLLSALWNGRFAVCVFFVLSGYVLTRAYSITGNVDVLRSLAARRYFRLGVPIFASVMFAFFLYTIGAYDTKATAEITKSAWLASQSIGDPSLQGALRDGIYGVLFLGHTQFNTVFWTMRVEFIGSMLIFSYALLSWEGRRRWFATAIYIVLIFFMAGSAWPYYLAFLLGSHIGNRTYQVPRWVPWACVGLAMYLASVDASPFFAPLNALPLEEQTRWVFCNVVAGALVVFSMRTGAFDAVLRSRPVQFLGRVSYPLYLVHAPIVMTLGCAIFNHLNPDFVRSVSVGVSLVCCIVCALLVAAFFERYVDQPAIRFGKWLVRTKAPRQLGIASVDI